MRATCAIARVVMARHSIRWRELVKEVNIEVAFDGFYVDDGRTETRMEMAQWRTLAL